MRGARRAPQDTSRRRSSRRTQKPRQRLTMSVAVLMERNRGRRPMPNAAERRWQTEICLARRTFPKPDRFQNQTRIRLLLRADAEDSVQDADRARGDELKRRKGKRALGHH